jgi:hypothetical protein
VLDKEWLMSHDALVFDALRLTYTPRGMYLYAFQVNVIEFISLASLVQVKFKKTGITAKLLDSSNA